MQETRCWRIELLNQLFAAEVVRLIKSIPFSFQMPPERLMWHYDNKGLFSVKSTYKVARMSCAPAVITTSPSTSKGGAYRGLGRLFEGLVCHQRSRSVVGGFIVTFFLREIT